jgi:hypothetical protein
MSMPIEGLKPEAPKIDGRSREARAMRAATRDDDTRPGNVRDDGERDTIREAEERAAQIEDELGSSISTNELDIPANLAPPGWVYELKCDSVAGQENRHHMLGLLRTGWRAVPASRHPHLMPANWDGPIVIKGLMLMEMPASVVKKRKDAEYREARDQVIAAEEQLNNAPPSTAPRDHPSVARAGLGTVQHDIMKPLGEPDRVRTR